MITGHPTVSELLKAKRKTTTILSSYYCDLEHAVEHRYSWIQFSPHEWLAKNNVVHVVLPLVHFEDYTDTTQSHKFKYKQESRIWLEYKQHIKTTVKYFIFATIYPYILRITNIKSSDKLKSKFMTMSFLTFPYYHKTFPKR